MQNLTLPESALLLPRVHGIADDFDGGYVSGDAWSAVLTDTGTAIISDQAGGVIVLTPSDGTVADNDEAYLRGTDETFLMANNKPLWFAARVAWLEANTDDANVAVGMMNAVAADSIQDNGAGPKADYSGFCFYKVDGGTAWIFESSLGTAQTTTILNYSTPASATDWHSLKVEVRSRGSTTLEIIPFIDTAGGQGYVQCVDTNGDKVKHTITLGSPTEMSIFAGVKNGGANNEGLNIDYLAAYQLR